MTVLRALWKLLRKDWPYLLVGVAVLVIYLKNPFGLFSPKHAKIENTPVSVKHVMDLGELITAQYYGEVLCTLKDALESKDSTYLATTYIRFRTNMLDWNQKNPKKHDKAKVRWLERKINNIAGEDRNNYLILFNLTLFPKQSGGSKHFISYMLNNNWPQFMKDNRSRIDLHHRQRKSAPELVYIGRGFVNAGVDLRNLSSDDFVVENDTLKMYRTQAKILDAGINPWFIPGKVPGFELLEAKKDRKISFDQIGLVKSSCIRRLKEDAEVRNILLRATVSGEEALTHFFSISDRSGSPSFSTVKLMGPYAAPVQNDTTHPSLLNFN